VHVCHHSLRAISLLVTTNKHIGHAVGGRRSRSHSHTALARIEKVCVLSRVLCNNYLFTSMFFFYAENCRFTTVSLRISLCLFVPSIILNRSTQRRRRRRARRASRSLIRSIVRYLFAARTLVFLYARQETLSFILCLSVWLFPFPFPFPVLWACGGVQLLLTGSSDGIVRLWNNFDTRPRLGGRSLLVRVGRSHERCFWRSDGMASAERQFDDRCRHIPTADVDL
jgi:hypothetical protein